MPRARRWPLTAALLLALGCGGSPAPDTANVWRERPAPGEPRRPIRPGQGVADLPANPGPQTPLPRK